MAHRHSAKFAACQRPVESVAALCVQILGPDYDYSGSARPGEALNITEAAAVDLSLPMEITIIRPLPIIVLQVLGSPFWQNGNRLEI